MRHSPWIALIVLGVLLLMILRPQASVVPTGEGTPRSQGEALPEVAIDSGAVESTGKRTSGLPEEGNRADPKTETLAPSGLEVTNKDNIRVSLWLAGEQMRHFQAEMEKAEAAAGESEFGYLAFLSARLEWMMRRDAVASLQEGKCYRIPGGSNSKGIPQDLFGGAPYMLFSGSEDGVSTQVAVPMVAAAEIRELERSVRSLRWDLVRRYADEFNAKPEAERVALRATCEGKGRVYPGLPKQVNDWTAHRLDWSEVGNYILLRDE